MTGIVFNKQNKHLALGWESYALRSSLCLFEQTICLGPSGYRIIYEAATSTANLNSKLHKLLITVQTEEERQQLEEVKSTLKHLRKRKHPQKQEIVFLKQTEKYINDCYALFIEAELKELAKFGLPQLAPFYFREEKSLDLWFVNDKEGETEKGGLLSLVLSFEVDFEFDKDPKSDVFVFYEHLAHEVIENHQLTPLAILPNLNNLDADKLQNVREQLTPLRKELETLLPLAKANEGEMQYYSGRWNLEGVKDLAPRLQEAINASPQLEWLNKIHTELRSELHVGNMDTLELWKLLRDHGFIPDDTWEVLEQKRKSGIHCPTTAIMTITSNWGSEELTNLSEEEALSHKRKTLDIN